MRTIKQLLICILLIFTTQTAFSQIIAPTGVATRASSQMIFHYDQAENETSDMDTTIHITNTNDTTGVWIHVQIFRSFDQDDDLNATTTDKVICDERNFVDFLTPNDTHIYDLDEDNFPKNMGETEGTPGEETSLTDTGDTLGFVIITPVVSEADLSAISFQHLIGTSINESDEEYVLNAMGRDAVDFTTGEIVSDGTPLDGETNGYVVLQPEELLFNFAVDDDDDSIDIVGIAFFDNYGPSGLLGYQVTPGSTNWTSFIFDFKEDPTSCGNRPVNCFISIGLNETIEQGNEELNPGPENSTDDLLCAGSETPEYDPMGMSSFDEPDFFGWTRIFISGIEPFENHIGLLVNGDNDGAEFMKVRGQRTEIIPEPEDEVCDDGIDNDEDGFTDCEDTDCATDDACETGEEECADGVDNDEDGQTDCADLGCDGFASCEFGTETSCEDGIDNDGDGAVDGDDTDCQAADTGGTGDDGDGGGCTVATSVTTATAAANFLLPLLPLFGAYGIRRIRNRR